MKPSLLLLSFLPALALAATAPTTATENAPAKESLAWLRDMLPVAFQKNPRVQTTVITEMTPAGKKLPPVSRDQPAYFVIATKGSLERGDPIPGDTPAKGEDIERSLVRALAPGGYLPAALPEHPPTLLLVYVWGAHHLVENGTGGEMTRSLLERATLVGGDKFAQQLAQAIRESENFALTTRERVPEGFQPNYSADTKAFLDPLNVYRMEGDKNDVLIDHATSELYFVQVIAYDFAGVMAKRRVPLWRTTMTVPSQGLTQELSLPSLVLAAGPHFGRDMDGPAIIQRRIVPEGKAEVGTPTVVPGNAKE